MSPTRRYFTKAVAPSPPPERSPAWDRQIVIGHLPSGEPRMYDSRWLRQVLGASKGGKACHAKGRAKTLFTSETARKALKKRWVGKRAPNRLVRGIRIGLRNPGPKVMRAELRQRYTQPDPTWHVRYDPGTRRWFVRDDLGERTCSERIALQYAGHLARPSVMARIPKQFNGINLDRERWNRDK
jgi:hypothetical protein